MGKQVRRGRITPVASIFRDPVAMTFVDADNRQLAEVTNPEYVPRAGENVRLRNIPYVVERIGYDIPGKSIERIWVVCRPA
jgi:hypothetical protein